MRRFERVLTIYDLSKNKKTIVLFHLKNIIFTAVKYHSILGGRVIVMNKLGIKVGVYVISLKDLNIDIEMDRTMDILSI